MTAELLVGDCLALLPDLQEGSVHAVVTDPPYGLGFMGREWDAFKPATIAVENGRRERKGTNRSSDRWPEKLGDTQGGGTGVIYDESAAGHRRYQEWCEAWASECLRTLRPGGYLLAFGGTRTYHRLAVAIEDAGFEIRDCLVWAYAQGFPKSLDVSKAIDRAAGAERPVIRYRDWTNPRDTPYRKHYNGDGPDGQPAVAVTGPATDEARQWAGWGTALKPAWEPIVLARKPLAGTVVENVLAHGTGALNIDGTRIPGPKGDGQWGSSNRSVQRVGGGRLFNGSTEDAEYRTVEHELGRWPPNLLLTDPIFDGDVAGVDTEGSYSRFFLVPKAGRAEREPAVRGQLVELPPPGWSSGTKSPGTFQSRPTPPRENTHPTVKPIELMRHLVRLVTPPGGVVLDPFLGSGTTALACEQEGFGWIGIEREEEYVALARARLSGAQRGLGL